MYERLNELCRKQGTTITAVCEKVTGNKGNLKTWKKGYMRSDWLDKVATLLDVSTDYLLGRNTEQIKKNDNDNDNDNKITNVENATNSNFGDNSTVNNYSKDKETQIDGLSKEMMIEFEQLGFSDKAKVMNLIAELSEKKRA